MTRRTALLSSVLPAAMCLGLSGLAAADPPPNCSDVANMAGATPLYVAGSSASLPLIKKIAAQFGVEATIANSPVAPTMVFFQPSGSCSAVQSLLNDPGPVMTCSGGPCLQGYAYYYPYNSVTPGEADQNVCMLDQGGVHLDVALSDVDSVACGAGPLGTSFSDTVGPAVAMELVMPSPSPAVSGITSAQAYFVFGFTCGGDIKPWTDSNFHFIREPGSGTAAIIQGLLGLPPEAMHGVYPDLSQPISGSEAVLNELAASKPEAEEAIGMLAASWADDYRYVTTKNEMGWMTALAFRATGQKQAYYPDSTRAGYDKQNVRDGHYPLFGYLHIITRLGQNALPTPLNAKFFVELFTGKRQFSSGFDMFQAIAKAHYIPQCAMTVQRLHDEPGMDGNPQVVPYADPQPCGCAYDVASDPIGSHPFDCVPCVTDSDCKVGNHFCRRGFCEAR